MGIEFERKYLVKSELWHENSESSAAIAQGYLGISSLATVRVRISSGRAWITIKGTMEGIGRPEFEYEIPVEDAEDQLANLSTTAIQKLVTH